MNQFIINFLEFKAINLPLLINIINSYQLSTMNLIDLTIQLGKVEKYSLFKKVI